MHDLRCWIVHWCGERLYHLHPLRRRILLCSLGISVHALCRRVLYNRQWNLGMHDLRCWIVHWCGERLYHLHPLRCRVLLCSLSISLRALCSGVLYNRQWNLFMHDLRCWIVHWCCERLYPLLSLRCRVLLHRNGYSLHALCSWEVLF